jgi:glycerol-3-phosphate dehydrogenase (NAD(P)+)
MQITVLGDGGWGTTLAILLFRKGYSVCLWSVSRSYASYLDRKRVNSKFLPGVSIPRGIGITADLRDAVEHRDLIILAVPSQYARNVLAGIKKLRMADLPEVLVGATKGIEVGTLKRMSEVVKEALGGIKFAVLSGPTIAREVVKGIPTTAVLASQHKKEAERLQNIFMTERFRVYTNGDLVGVELGGSLKNVIAIACGISDGLGFGTNTKAALLARGMAEISRLGQAMGAKAATFSGLSGLGDLVTTCISPYSRNRFVGEQIGKGKSLKEITNHMQMVAEGVPTAKSAYSLSLKYKVDMPITKEVFRVLYKNKAPLKAVRDLMTREKRSE